MTPAQAYAIGLQRARTEKLASKDYLAASVLGALLGSLTGAGVGGQIGYWFSPSPYYRDVNWSELRGKMIGAGGGALAGAGIGAAALGILRALKP